MEIIKKEITKQIKVTVPMFVDRIYKITKQVEIDKEELTEDYTEDEYIEDNYEVEFFKEAEQNMDKDIGEIHIPFDFESSFDDYESEFDN